MQGHKLHIDMEGLEHPSQARVPRYPLDDALRAAGWEIVARPPTGQPLWRRKPHGQPVTEWEAIELLRLEHAKSKGKTGYKKGSK